MTQATLKLYSVSLGLLLLLSGCGQARLTGTPIWNGKIWAGDPDHGQVIRAQDPPPNTISAFDPKFKDGIWMSYADLSCMYFSFVNNCKDWFTLTPSCPSVSKKELSKFFIKYEAYRNKYLSAHDLSAQIKDASEHREE